MTGVSESVSGAVDAQVPGKKSVNEKRTDKYLKTVLTNWHSFTSADHNIILCQTMA